MEDRRDFTFAAVSLVTLFFTASFSVNAQDFPMSLNRNVPKILADTLRPYFTEASTTPKRALRLSNFISIIVSWSDSTENFDLLKVDSCGLPHTTQLEKRFCIDSLRPLRLYREKIGLKFSDVAETPDQFSTDETSKVKENISTLSKKAYGEGVLPLNISSANIKRRQQDVPNGSLDINGFEIPKIEPHKFPEVMSRLEAGQRNMEKIEVKALNEVGLQEIKAGALSQAKELQDKVGDEITEVSADVSTYVQDASAIRDENIDKVKQLKEDALKEASLGDELAVLNEGEKVLEEQKALMSAQTKDAYKEQVLSRGKELALQHFSKYNQQVQEIASKVATYQQKAGTVLAKSKELPKRRDPLQKLEAYERLVPGLNFQIHDASTWLMDINPSVKYRITSYWSAGSGYLKRYQFRHHERTYSEINAFGIRSFSEVVIFKGISARVEGEYVNALIRPLGINADEPTRKWIWNYAGGVRKDFSITRTVTGNVQFMYNLYDPKHFRVYPTRFNVRCGIDLPLIAKKRQSSKTVNNNSQGL